MGGMLALLGGVGSLWIAPIEPMTFLGKAFDIFLVGLDFLLLADGLGLFPKNVSRTPWNAGDSPKLPQASEGHILVGFALLLV